MHNALVVSAYATLIHHVYWAKTGQLVCPALKFITEEARQVLEVEKILPGGCCDVFNNMLRKMMYRYFTQAAKDSLTVERLEAVCSDS